MTAIINPDVCSLIGEEDIPLRRLTPYAEVRSQDFHQKSRPASTLRHNFEDIRSKSFPNNDDVATKSLEPKEIYSTMVVNGKENNDAPIEYFINGLQSHEFPVKGVYVHHQIIPGFPYRVRYIGSQKYLFDGEARCLESIGIGYGKRLTFTGDTWNHNDCYFWSDSSPDGFAFSLAATQRKQKFVIYNAQMEPVGEVVIDDIKDQQKEESTDVVNGEVCKRVFVTIEASINYYQRQYGLLDLCQSAVETISGVALLVKPKREKRASMRRIENVFLSRFGKCSLHKDG